jgi:integrase
VTALAPTLQAFFTDRLARQRDASPHTVAAYRDTWRLLLAFTAQRTGRQPFQLEFADLDATLVGAFLDHLERERGNTARTRNARLAAVHSLFRYAALRHPQDAEVIARVLAIPLKRFDRALVTYLTEPEVAALLAAPNPVHLGRPPRLRADPAGRPDRAARLRADRADLRRRAPRHRGARLLPGQGPQTANHPAHHVNSRGPPHLAGRTRRPARTPAVPRPRRRPAQPRRY